MKNLLRYTIARTLLTIPMLLILLTIVFVVIRVMPGDPVSAMLGGHAPQKVIDEKREELGLNRPLIIQYFDYLWQVARLDLGESMIFKQRVHAAMRDKIPATFELTIFGMCITLMVGIPLGIYAADKRRSPQDYAIRLYGIVIYCIPVYWLGLIFQLIFGIWLDLFPIAGRTGGQVFASDFEWSGLYVLDTLVARDFTAFGDVLMHLVLPSFTLGLVLSGIFIRLTRANMLDVLQGGLHPGRRGQGFPKPSAGWSTSTAFLNAFVPILTMMGLQVSPI